MAQLSDEQLAAIAHDFYLSNMNIADISQKYQLSRYLIGKALHQAKSRNIVHITIKKETPRNSELEAKFKKLFHLKDVFILKKLETKTQDEEQLISFTAKQIQNYMKQTKYIGLTWGTTLLDIINNLEASERRDLTFIQMLGVPPDSGHRKGTLVRKAAKKFDSRSLNLPSPLYILNPETVKMMKREPFFKVLDENYQRLNLAISGVGTMQSIEEDEFAHQYYEQELFAHQDKKKVCGFIFGRPFDQKGKLFNQIDNHICGISTAEIRNIPIRFIIEKNRFKTAALLGALRTGLITHLATNEGIALRMLQMIKEQW